MSLSPQALPDRLQAWLSRLAPSAARPVAQPLLDAPAIMALFHQARQQTALATSQQDVAHRRLGDSRSVYRGAGLDYEESRPYQAGDERRFMNWRVTARTGELTMKVFREERKPGTFILLDRRCSMRFGSRRRLKVTQAVRAAALLAFSAQQQNMPVSGVVLENKPDWHGESHDPLAAFRLINAAARPCPPCQQASGAPSLVSVLKLLQAMLTPGSRVFLVSDFYDADQSIRPLLLGLAQQHRLTAIHIIDAAEQQLPDAGLLELYEADRQHSQLVDSSDPALRARFESQAAELLKQRQRLFTALGLGYLHLQTDTEAIAAVLAQA